MLGTNGHRAVLTAWLFSSLRGYIQNIKTTLITSYISAVKKKVLVLHLTYQWHKSSKLHMQLQSGPLQNEKLGKLIATTQLV